MNALQMITATSEPSGLSLLRRIMRDVKAAGFHVRHASSSELFDSTESEDSVAFSEDAPVYVMTENHMDEESVSVGIRGNFTHVTNYGPVFSFVTVSGYTNEIKVMLGLLHVLSHGTFGDYLNFDASVPNLLKVDARDCRACAECWYRHRHGRQAG